MTRKATIFALFSMLLFSINPLLSQQIEWAYQVNGFDFDIVYEVEKDQSGNILAIGAFEGSIAIGGQSFTSEEGSDIFLVKLTPEGNVIWKKLISGFNVTGDAGLATDKNNNVYVVGEFIRDLRYDGSLITTGSNNRNSFILKLDENGNVLWSRTIRGLNDGSIARVIGNIDANEEGELAVAFVYNGDVEFINTVLSRNTPGDNLVISRMTTNGSIDWYRIPDTETNNEARDVAIDNFGNVYATGFYSGTLNWGTEQLVAPDNVHNEIFVLQSNSGGSSFWARSFNKTEQAPEDNQGNALYINGEEEKLLVSGFFNNDIEVGSSVLQGSGQSDIFLNTLQLDGTIVGGQQLGTTSQDAGLDITQTELYKVVAGGIDRKPTLIRLLPNGAELDRFTLDSRGFITSVSAIDDNSFIVSGYFEGALNSDPFFWQSTEQDGFIMRINFNCEPNSAPILPEIEWTCETVRLRVYNGTDNIKWFYNGQPLSFTSSEIPFQGEGVYRVALSNGCGSTFSNAVVADLELLFPPAPEINETCDAFTVINNTDFDISWFKNSTLISNASSVLKTPGTYRVVFTDECGATDTTFNYSGELSKPVIRWDCQTVYTVNTDSDVMLSWYYNETLLMQQGSSIPVQGNGNYRVSATDECVTVSSDPVFINLTEFLPPAPEFEEQCNEIRLLNAASYEVKWFRGSELIPVDDKTAILEPGKYIIEYTNGCGSNQTLVIIEERNYELYNVITPNDDNKNEVFVVDEKLKGLPFTVFNRWGNTVYQNDNYQNDWNGSTLDSGIYFWQISDPCNTEIKGILTILK